MRTVEGVKLEELNLFLLVHANVPPADDDWAVAIEQTWAPFARGIRAKGIAPLCLVWTPSGHGPNAKQRRSLDATNAAIRPRVAVVSASTVARGIVTAVSWFGHTEIRAFSPDELKHALSFLGLAERHSGAVRAALRAAETGRGVASL